jgi:hypothetical protein
MWLMGTRWMCAWGTSRPMTAVPMRAQGTTFSIALAYFSGKELQTDVLVLFEVKNVIDLRFGDGQGMALGDGVDVQKGEEIVCFRHFVAGDLPIDDFGEDRGHGVNVKFP